MIPWQEPPPFSTNSVFGNTSAKTAAQKKQGRQPSRPASILFPEGVAELPVRFHRSVRIGKLVRLNVGKRGIGVSVGVKGLRAGIGSRGAYTSVGVPGTGLYSVNYMRQRSKANKPAPRVTSDSSNASLGILEPPLDIRRPGAGWTGAAVLCILIGLAYHPLIVVGLGIVAYLIYRGQTPGGKAFSNFAQGSRAYSAGAYDTAAEAFRQALEEYPSATRVNGALGAALRRAGKAEEAVLPLEAYRELCPGPEADLELSHALCGCERYQEAVPLLQGLPEPLSQAPPIVNMLGLTFISMGKPQLAIEALKKGPVLKRTWDDDKIMCHYLLGMAYKDAGEKRKALREFNKVYAQDSTFMDVKEHLEALQNKESTEESR